MASTNSTPPRAWFGLVKELEERNGTLTIQAVDRSKPDAATPEHKVRLIRIVDNAWILERPFAKSGELGFSPNRTLYGIVGTGPSRFGFNSTVINTETFQLNDASEIPVIRIESPRNIATVQRRAYYRVAAAALDLRPITAWPLNDINTARLAETANQHAHKHPDIIADTIRPSLGMPIHGRIFDISGNGIALITDAGNAPVFNDMTPIWLEFYLPENPIPFAVVARTIRVSPLGDSEIQVGLQYQFAHNPAHAQFITDNVCRFSAEQQRLQLIRHREG